jgi:hypothetical protein
VKLEPAFAAEGGKIGRRHVKTLMWADREHPPLRSRRRGHNEFVTTGLLAEKRTLAQQIMLVLVETALQAEQQASIALLRGIDCLPGRSA